MCMGEFQSQSFDFSLHHFSRTDSSELRLTQICFCENLACLNTFVDCKAEQGNLFP